MITTIGAARPLDRITRITPNLAQLTKRPVSSLRSADYLFGAGVTSRGLLLRPMSYEMMIV